MLMRNKKQEQPKTAQSRRGIAIETAMLFLLVVVALSTLLVSVTLMQAGKVERSDEKLERYMVLEKVGEDFCSYRQSYNLPEELAQVFYIEKSATTLRVYPRPEEGTPPGEVQPVLTVELSDIDGTYKVTKWSYGE